MELDEYKIASRQLPADIYTQKAVPELGKYLLSKSYSTMDSITYNLKLEIIFALVFAISDSYVLIFSKYNHLRVFAGILLIFCFVFTFYLLKLLRYVQVQQIPVVSVRSLLERNIHIIHRFTRLYFQLTLVMIPMIFFLLFITGYIDHRWQPGNIISYSPQRIWIYISFSVAWSFMMYFFTKWYLKRLYGNHLNKLKEQLKELKKE